MAWQLLAAALPAAAKIAGTALSKPRQEDYAPQTDYMKKYLSYIRGRSSDREVMHQAMQPALRVAGKQGRQMQRQVGYDVAKSGLGGSGIEAQMRLSAGQQTQEALATATDKAVAAQTAETARIGQQAAGITAQIGAEEARADQAFKSAESQWKRQLASDVIGAGASLASAGISQYGENIAGFRQAVMDGSVPAGTTYSQFKGMAKGGVIEGAPELGIQKAELGSMSPAEYAQYSGASKQQISGLKLAEGVYGSADKIKELRASGISDADIISNAQRMQSMYVSQGGSGADPVLIQQAMQQVGFGSQTVGSVPESDIGFDPAPEQNIMKDIKEATKKGKEAGVFDPEGSDYDLKRANELEYKREDDPSGNRHLPSLDSETGRVLKGRGNKKEWDLMLEKEEKIGNKIVKKDDGYYYSVPKEVKKPATKAETLTISRGTVKGEKVPDISIPKGKTPEEIAELLSYDKDLLKSFAPMRDYYGLSDEDWKKLKNIIESGKTLASAG